jgi:hypothetical protein
MRSDPVHPHNASRTAAARPRDAQYDSPQAQAVKQPARRAAMNGINFPPGRPCCRHDRGGLGSVRHPSGCRGRACVRAPGVVRMCGRMPLRRISKEHHGNGCGSRVWDEDRQ